LSSIFLFYNIDKEKDYIKLNNKSTSVKNEVVLQLWYMPKTYLPIFYLHLCHVKDYKTLDIWGFCRRQFFMLASVIEYVSSVTDLNGVTAAVVMLQIAIHEMLSSNLRQNKYSALISCHAP